VHGRGVEPLRLAAAEPKSAASASFATRAVNLRSNPGLILTVGSASASSGAKGHFFVVLADKDHVFFEYQPKHTSDAVCAMFKGFKGYIQADAHCVYDALFRGKAVGDDEKPPDEVACWSHARRPALGGRRDRAGSCGSRRSPPRARTRLCGVGEGRSLADRVVLDRPEGRENAAEDATVRARRPALPQILDDGDARGGRERVEVMVSALAHRHAQPLSPPVKVVQRHGTGRVRIA
jgi:hypothetical protein